MLHGHLFHPFPKVKENTKRRDGSKPLVIQSVMSSPLVRHPSRFLPGPRWGCSFLSIPLPWWLFAAEGCSETQVPDNEPMDRAELGRDVVIWDCSGDGQYRRTLQRGYSLLRSRIPTEPQDRKLSHIETLQLARSYIQHLRNMLKARKAGYHGNHVCGYLSRTEKATSSESKRTICTFCCAAESTKREC